VMTNIIRPAETSRGLRLPLLIRHIAYLRLVGGICLLGCTTLGSSSLVDQAEQLTEGGRYLDAIDTYRNHIQERLDDSARPDWENPYFYLLRIVDLQLKQERPQDALRTCREAEQQGIDLALISDRYRAIAIWYEEHGDLSAAFEILKSHREKDPLLFDAMLDRVGRAITASEAGAGKKLQK
jgi:hypothetical protein